MMNSELTENTFSQIYNERKKKRKKTESFNK